MELVAEDGNFPMGDLVRDVAGIGADHLVAPILLAVTLKHPDRSVDAVPLVGSHRLPLAVHADLSRDGHATAYGQLLKRKLTSVGP